jgi:hypothetical protein
VLRNQGAADLVAREFQSTVAVPGPKERRNYISLCGTHQPNQASGRTSFKGCHDMFDSSVLCFIPIERDEDGSSVTRGTSQREDANDDKGADNNNDAGRRDPMNDRLWLVVAAHNNNNNNNNDKHNGGVVTMNCSRRAMQTRSIDMKTLVGIDKFRTLLQDAVDTAKLNTGAVTEWLNDVTPPEDEMRADVAAMEAESVSAGDDEHEEGDGDVDEVLRWCSFTWENDTSLTRWDVSEDVVRAELLKYRGDRRDRIMKAVSALCVARM